jgi:hypothetical protein
MLCRQTTDTQTTERGFPREENMDESYLTRCLTSATDNIFVFSRGYQRIPTTFVTFEGIDVYAQNTATVTTSLQILCGQTPEHQRLKAEKGMVLVMLKIPENIYPLTLFSQFLAFRTVHMLPAMIHVLLVGRLCPCYPRHVT